MNQKGIKRLLDEKVAQYNQAGFLESDPVGIPHAFSLRQDIEIMGFFAAVLAWGQRVTIMNKCRELAALMDNSPWQFVCQHTENDLKRLLAFKHRTFNATDLLYFMAFLRQHYAAHPSLESAFTAHVRPGDTDTGNALAGFHRYFFSLPDFPPRTRKHIPDPLRKSSCKRLNMYLRWMVRHDGQGVDFGLWKGLSPAQLVCPLDVHVERVARQLGLITQPRTGWLAALELTARLREFDAADPVKYDFALFGLGLEQKTPRTGGKRSI